MDIDTIKRINREALRQAQDAEKQQSLTCYLVAALIGVAAYFAIRYYKPGFILSKDAAGQPQIDQVKLVLAAVGCALVVLVAYHYLF